MTKLPPAALAQAIDLLKDTRAKLTAQFGHDPELLYFANRYVAGRLKSDEHGPSGAKEKLRRLLRSEQKNLCAHCNQPLPEKDVHMHRLGARPPLYVHGNVQLLHKACHDAVHAAKHKAA